ncbi:hypothetical protein AKJ63_02080 [candidate division MSBL1 archaeon SCGC-AAA259D18]|uniref:Uncharacterized protein n=1 Tax=candidate division MSBL1 archaeon SCGC-AAA259D18 TaxID=1698262 RepID=A0A133U9U2_9EURY|nr:hypothetical protein AKJ63_02080 [candidate division MSBL1 archaeon SCGC-AAA259D18]
MDLPSFLSFSELNMGDCKSFEIGRWNVGNTTLNFEKFVRKGQIRTFQVFIPQLFYFLVRVKMGYHFELWRKKTSDIYKWTSEKVCGV